MNVQQFLGYYLDKHQRVLSLMGPSGTGKSFSADFLQKYLGYNVTSQLTTRAPRPDDKHYKYISKEDFIKLEQDGKILGIFAGDRKTLDGNGYGYLTEEVMDEISTKGKIILFSSAYELEQVDFRDKYGTADKIGLGFRNPQTVFDRACQCNKELSSNELKSRIETASLLTHIMEKYNKLGDSTFNLIYSDEGSEDVIENKNIQLGKIVQCMGFNPDELQNDIEDYING